MPRPGKQAAPKQQSSPARRRNAAPEAMAEDMRPRRIFTGTSHFPTLRENGAAYVDKTALIHRMVNSDTAFFLSRPRRFGKSLLVTTQEAYFQGRKSLFEGLAVEKLQTEWPVHPVIRLDMSGVRPENPEELGQLLQH